MTYLQALQQLQYWLTNNQASHANHLNFNAHPLSTDELQAIREYTKKQTAWKLLFIFTAMRHGGIFSIRGTPAW